MITFLIVIIWFFVVLPVVIEPPVPTIVVRVRFARRRCDFSRHVAGDC